MKGGVLLHEILKMIGRGDTLPRLFLRHLPRAFTSSRITTPSSAHFTFALSEIWVATFMTDPTPCRLHLTLGNLNSNVHKKTDFNDSFFFFPKEINSRIHDRS